MRSASQFSFRLSTMFVFVMHLMRHWYLRIFHNHKSIHGVRVILLHGGRVVLVRHWWAPHVWTLPGGGVAAHETVEEAGAREAREEAGFTVNSWGGEVGTYHGGMGKRDTVRVLFSDDLSGNIKFLPNGEIMDRGLFDPNDLPANISPANRRRIESFMRGARYERGPW